MLIEKTMSTKGSKPIIQVQFQAVNNWEATGDSGWIHSNQYYTTTRLDPGFFYVITDFRMLFHDIFEHYFEGTPPFVGEYMNNYAGEVTAMGHLYYYASHDFEFSSLRSFKPHEPIYSGNFKRDASILNSSTISDIDFLSRHGEDSEYGDTFNPVPVNFSTITGPVHVKEVGRYAYQKWKKEYGYKAMLLSGNSEQRKYAESLTEEKLLQAFMLGYRTASKKFSRYYAAEPRWAYNILKAFQEKEELWMKEIPQAFPKSWLTFTVLRNNHKVGVIPILEVDLGGGIGGTKTVNLANIRWLDEIEAIIYGEAYANE